MYFQKLLWIMKSAQHCHPERSEGSVSTTAGVTSDMQIQHCHPERSEGSIAMGRVMLRGVYTERSECTQHDSAVTHTDAWTNLLKSIIVGDSD